MQHPAAAAAAAAHPCVSVKYQHSLRLAGSTCLTTPCCAGTGVSNGNKMQASQLRADHTCQASHLWCCPLGRQTQTGGMSLPLPASRCRPPPPVEARGAVETAAGGDTSVARTVAKDVPQAQWSVLSVYLACLPGKESAQSCSSNLPASASRGRLRCGGQCRTAGRPPGAGWGQSQSRP